MINIIPQTEVRLLKTPLEKDSEHTLSFNNINSQTTYFINRTFKAYSEFTYQKETQSLVVPDSYDVVCTCNYLMYKNAGFTSKYFYAFITKMEYVNENATRVYFEIDSLQTWYFNINYNASFIEREHANSDNIGDNVLPESLEIGEYVNIRSTTDFSNGIGDYVVCVATTDVPVGATIPTIRLYTGIYGGLYYFIFNDYTEIEKFLQIYDKQAMGEAVYAIFMVPKKLPCILNGTSYTWSLSDLTATMIYPTRSPSADLLGKIETDMPTQLDQNYVPKNKKLYTYPFNYLMVTNNSGTEAIYRYEDFDDPTDIEFNVYATITPGMSIKAYPLYYKNIGNYIEGISFGKLPICSWTTDVYVNWLTQNSLNTTIQFAANAAGTLLSAGDKNVGGIISGIQGMANVVQQKTVASLTPDQAKGNTNNGDINFTSSHTGLTVHYMGIKKQFLQIIDDFFSKYGYATNRVKTPNINGRRNWNYVKTINCDFTGEVPQEDLQKIKDIFNKGITFWHNPSNFLNYSVNNDII